jgi:hypothetical protein
MVEYAYKNEDETESINIREDRQWDDRFYKEITTRTPKKG